MMPDFFPGKYDKELTQVLEQIGAKQGILLVLDGNKGSSFCCHLEFLHMQRMPIILRAMADKIEESYKKL